MNSEEIHLVKEILSTPKKIVITPHKNPDGDAVGSVLALWHYLKQKDHEATVIVPNDFPIFLKWMPGVDDIIIFEKNKDTSSRLIEEAEIIFTLDFNDLSRIGSMQEHFLKADAKFIMIDHHQEPEPYATVEYSDVDKIRAFYNAQNEVKGYKKLKSEVEVIGCWDDHDYGLNDGGVEWSAKEGSQQAFLDFMDVPGSSPRRLQEGIYTAYNYELVQKPGKIKIIVLDTRYFRTSLSPDPSGEKRYIPNEYGEGTVLGETQWEWLAKELTNSQADFNIIISSIQFLSDQHGFEAWGNFPHEVDRLKKLIVESQARGVFILSGDRHISEFSKLDLEGLPYPLIDFTSSSLTNPYREFSGENNPYRLGEVVFTENFGLVKFNMVSKKIRFQIIGDEGTILGEIEQQY